jgi:hypothetical protein
METSLSGQILLFLIKQGFTLETTDLKKNEAIIEIKDQEGNYYKINVAFLPKPTYGRDINAGDIIGQVLPSNRLGISQNILKNG